MERLNTESIDLIYLDPPFNSNRDYNSIYKDETGRHLPDQIQAFTDTWTFSSKTEKAFKNTTIKMLTAGLSSEAPIMWESFVKGLRSFDDKMVAYMLWKRL